MDNDINDKTLLLLSTLLPKKLAGAEEEKILTVLNRHFISLIPGSDYTLPSFPVSQPIVAALYSARRTGRLIRGFEAAEKRLSAERAGIANADMKTGNLRKERISRLVVVANDGSDRFYRQTRKLVEQNMPKVLAIHLDISSLDLGEKLFGPGKRSLLLLINHKDAVINFLISLIR